MDEERCCIGLDEHHGSLQFPTSALMGSSAVVHCCQVYDFDCVDRASYSSSPDDADPSTSPIDLICERELRAVAASSSSDDEPSPLGWPLARQQRSKLRMSPATPRGDKSMNFGIPVSQLVMPSSPTSAGSSDAWTNKPGKKQASELEMMKERFSKLLLGEDMSGCGKGVCTALAVSNAITNLAASVFGELWKLEPLSLERKAMWNREMDWLLSVCDHIVEFVPSFHSVSDGSSLEVMISRPRSDLHINLPALRKLDAMLLSFLSQEALDSFKETDFWYVDQGVSVAEDVAQRNHSKQDVPSSTQRQEDKWWLPVPKIPPGGLSEKSRKALQYQRDCTSQILKAAMAINEQVLSEMQVPDVYWESLPKSARSCLGERIYYGLAVEHFSPDALLSSIDLSTEHNALEVANRIQSAVHVWWKKAPACYANQNKGATSPRHHRDGSKAASSRYPWSKVKELVAECDSDRRMVLIERAESLLLCLRQRFPGLPQTVLDVNKIQYNKDVGQAILESYSRVLESLAFSILSRIDDVLYIADMTKRNGGGLELRGSRKLVATVACVSHGTPFATPYASPGSESSASSSSLSPSPLRQVNAAVSTTATATATTEPNSVCPSFLGALCSPMELGDGVKEAKKPRERPWIDIENRRSFYSPPGRD